MFQSETEPDLKHLVLLGGGHAQVSVLKSLIMQPIRGLRVTLISRDILTPYSGMLPGYLEGLYSDKDITIDLSHLARLAGARFIHGSVVSLDADRRKLTIEGYPEMGYDLLSINIGSSPDMAAIKGAKDHAIPVKPISQLLARLHPVLDELPQDQKKSIAIIGGGAGGVEMALSLHHRLNIKEQRNIDFILIGRSPRFLSEFTPQAAATIMPVLKSQNITCHLGVAVEEIRQEGVMLANGDLIKADHVLAVTAGRPAPFLATSGLALDEKGFVAVNDTLQSTSHDTVFAAGDIASVIGSPRPKAGVFAVRAGPIMTQNLRRQLLEDALQHWKPQKNYLALIGTGGRKAMAVRGKFVLPPSHLLWRLKEWIDRRFIEKFSTLPQMPQPSPSPLAQLMANQGHDGEAALAAMRCLGCGAKTGFSDLDQGITDAQAYLCAQGIDLDQEIKTNADSASIDLPQNRIVQSVDAISALVDDPFILGRIAALHAMSDLFSSHAKPHSALAILTLPHAFSTLQKNDITQILAGAMLALHQHGAKLAGGHTSAGADLQVGFAVTGLASDAPLYTPQDGDVLILTKPLGIGVIMAAHADGNHDLADGLARQAAIDVMAQSNGIAAETFADFGCFPMTDVTGFGLARHGLSLASTIGDGTASLEFDLDDLPLLSPSLSLAEDGAVSSLFHANRLAAPARGATSARGASPARGDHPALPLIYDPQTGGGLLAVVPQDKADAILQKLLDAELDAAMIGRISLDGQAEIRIK